MKLILKQQFMDGYKYDFFDENETLLYEINKEGPLINDFKIYKNKELIGAVKDLKSFFLYGFVFIKDDKKIGDFLEKITLSIPKFNFSTKNWTAISDSFDWNNYKVYDKNNELIMSVKKRIRSVTKCYDVEINEQENILYCLMIILSLTTTEKRKRRFQ